MASGGKKKAKAKPVRMNLSEFLGTSEPVISAPKKMDWATEMENIEDDFDGQPSFDRSVLPKAPKAARGPDVDMTKVPSQPPFTAFIGNLPYEACETKIEMFFGKLKLLNVRLPSDQGRLRGFGYVEFEDRDSLLEALTMDDSIFAGRKIRIDLAGQNQGGPDNKDGGGGGMGRREEPEKLSGDWRKAATDDNAEERNNDDRDGGGRFGSRDGDRDGGGRFGDRDGGRYGGDRDGGRYGGDRDGGRYGGDRDGGRYGGDRDSGRYGSDRDGGRYGGDGGRYGGDRDGGRYGSDRGYGGDRDGGRYGSDRDGGRYGGNRDRYGDRDGGRYGGSRDGYRSGGRYGGSSGGDRPRESNDEAPRERKKLQIAPRSKPLENNDSAPTKSSSIFGGAKPVDTAAKDREIGERERFQSEKKTETPKEKRPSIFGDAKPVNTAAKEKEIEERLRKQQETGRILSTDDRNYDRTAEDNLNDDLANTDKPSGRTRRDSEEHKRERHLSNSSSGKSSRQGHNSGGNRSRKDSEISNHSSEPAEDGHHPTSPKHEDTTPVKIIPAPPPKENAWAKRKPEIMSPPSQPQVPAAKPSENDTTKNKPRAQKDTTPRSDRPRYGRDDHDRRDDRGVRGDKQISPANKYDGKNKENTKPRKEKAIPKSIDEMPKYNKNESKDWSDKNKFSLISSSKSDDDEEEDEEDKETTQTREEDVTNES